MAQPEIISTNSTRALDNVLDWSNSQCDIPMYFVIVATVYLTFIDFFIISGNLWVISVILTKLSKSMYLLASLVVSDLLTGIASIPLYLLWLHHGELFVSHPMCFGTMMTSFFLSVASILNILAMTMERFIAICFPIFHRSFVKVNFKMLVSVTVSGIWLTSFLTALFSLLFMKSDFQTCSYYNVFDGQFLFWAIILGVFSPLCLLALMYIKMFMSVRKCFRRETSELRSRSLSQSSENRQKNINKSLRKMVTTLCLVLASFMVCWGPFFITIFLRVICEWCQLPLLAYEVILLLGMTNSLTNPLIYCLRHKSFRSLVRRKRFVNVFENKEGSGINTSSDV